MTRTTERIDRATEALAEVDGAVLGDKRLNARLQELVWAVAARPGESLPKALGSESALEATYRFLGNERVSPPSILAPHMARTQARCEEHERVLAIFDTTEARFGGDREGLGYLAQKGRGLLAHVGLAVTADGRRDPLGVLHCETITRRAAKKSRREAKGATDSESWRWHRGVEAVHAVLPGAICVMDREADIFSLVAQMQSCEQPFVIRAAQNRATLEGPLWELLDETELVTTRDVDLAERRPRRGAREKKKYPSRSAHTATLELRARTVTLRAPAGMNDASVEQYGASLPLHLVHVIEPHPPDGDEPVEWMLLTNLPITTKSELDFIVDAYRARWVIEEFFKALKSGCALEKRQLEGIRSVTNLIAVFLPIAWLLLRLRNLSRDEPHRLATGLLSPRMLGCLRFLYEKRRHRKLPAKPTCKELVWAIAGLGGHITNNGEPGLIVLGRGLADLLFATDVAEALGVEA